MSDAIARPEISLPDGTTRTVRKLTYREARYVQARLDPNVTDKATAARIAGFPVWMQKHTERIDHDGEVAALIEELRGALAQHAVEASLIDAAEIHEYLTDAIRARRSDIQNDDHTYKPLSEWPDIWQRMAEDGDIEVRYASERSHDGETKDKAGGWDETDKIVQVRYKFGRKAELLKMAMQHRAVDAMVPRGADAQDVAGAVMSAIDARIAEGRKRAAQRIEAGDIIDVEASPARDTKS